MKKLDRDNGLIYFSDYDTDTSIYLDNISDKVDDILNKMIIGEYYEKLYEEISLLNMNDKMLLDAIFFNDLSRSECAYIFDSCPVKVMRQRDKILQKLKKRVLKFNK